MRRHSSSEITSLVRQVEELIAGGRSQADACKTLGVSVMTFHRWRKQEAARGAHTHEASDAAFSNQGRLSEKSGPELPEGDRIDELRLENSRLRRIVTDLLLEKMRIEEKLTLQERTSPVRRGGAEN